MNACRTIQSMLGPYALKDLPSADETQVSEHLSHCRPCRTRVQALGPVVAHLQQEVAALPRWQPTPEFDARLLTAVRAEMNRTARPSSWGRRLTLTAVAVGVLVFVGLRPGLQADLLADALDALRTATSVHIVGSTTLRGGVGEDGRPIARPARNDPMEMWWAGEGREWQRIGEDVFVATPTGSLLRSPKLNPAGKGPLTLRFTEGVKVDLRIQSRINPDYLLSQMRDDIARGRAQMTTERMPGEIIVTVKQGRNHHELHLTDPGNQLIRQRSLLAGTGRAPDHTFNIDSITYNEQVPESVQRDIRLAEGSEPTSEQVKP